MKENSLRSQVKLQEYREPTEFFPEVRVSADASGAYSAGKAGDIVVIVDVIDMSTTVECVIEAGCLTVYGAAPDYVNPPVPVNPERIGILAGTESTLKNVPILIVTEPRWGTESDFKKNAGKVVTGIIKVGGVIAGFFPNLGSSTTKLGEFEDKIVVIVTDTGGTAFDAAFNAGGIVLTGTIARTNKHKSIFPALIAAKRAVNTALQEQKNISIIAASANSLEDILASQYIAQKVLELIRS